MPLLDDEDPRIQYEAAGSETEFDFPFLVYSDAEGSSSHLKVIRVRSGVAETLAVPADYTVEGLDEEAGGTITLDSAALADDIYILYREVPIQTMFNFATAGDYFATDVNKGNNLILQICQQLRLAISRAAVLPPESTLESLALPIPEALKYLQWNSDGTALQNADGLDEADPATIKVSNNDTTAAYLLSKLIEGAGIVLAEISDGGNETLEISVDPALELQNYTEVVDLHGSAVVGATETIDLANGNIHKILLDVNCTLTFTGAPAAGISASFTLYVKQDGSGGNTITWPGAVQWRGGTAPAQTTTSNALDIYVFSTIDGGTSWQGAQIGAAFA